MLNWFLCKVRNVYLISFLHTCGYQDFPAPFIEKLFGLVYTFDTSVKHYRGFITETCILYFFLFATWHIHTCVYWVSLALLPCYPPSSLLILLLNPILPSLLILCCLFFPIEFNLWLLARSRMGLLFIKTWVAYQWVHHWRSWHPLHQHPITAHCPSARGGTSWSLTHTWWSGDGSNLVQWVLECYGPILSKSHHSTILLPNLWFLHSFRHLFRNVPWTLGRLIRCPVCDRAEFPILFHWSTCLFLC